MDILMLHPHDIYSSSEPWTIRIRRIADEFIKKGHSVKLVYFPQDKNDAYKERVENGIKIYPMNRRVGIFNFFRNIIRIAKFSRECDIVHFQKCHYNVSLPALIASFIYNKPLHYDWDDWETKIFYYSNPHQRVVGEFINLFEHLMPRLVHTISVSSNRIKDLCIERGAEIKNIFYAPVGSLLKTVKNNDNNTEKIKKCYNISNSLVLYVGQLHGGQYAELFIKAACIVIESGFDAHFMVVGDGYKLAALKSLAKKLNIATHVTFTGAVKHDVVSDYILAADICIACFDDNDITRCKSPLKVVEYLSCGKPIVASNVGEVRNMVGGVGLLVKPGSAKSLAHGIMNILKDDIFKANLNGWGRERVRRKYNWEITSDNILQAYGRACQLNQKLKKRRC